jgi:hypothetical protein
MPSAFSKHFTREVAPQSHRLWQYERQDENIRLQTTLTEWLEHVTVTEGLFKYHVYENSKVSDYDLRQHRNFLHALMADGGALAANYIDFGNRTEKLDEIKPAVALIDQKLKELFDTLLAWHGPLSAQSDIPESFKQAVSEVEQGNIVDFKEP